MNLIGGYVMKRTFAALLAALTALTALITVPVGAGTSGDWIYSISDGEAIIEQYTGAGGDVTIPETLGGCPVTYVGSWTFADCETATSVTLCSSLREITDSAFAWLGPIERLEVDPANSVFSSRDGILYSKDGTRLIRAPAGATLGDFAVSDGVTEIAPSAFALCESLRSVTIPESVTDVGYGAFYSCRSLESVALPDALKALGESAFSGCEALSTVDLPAGIEAIEASTFSGSAIEKIAIPDAVTYLGDYAFSNCALLSEVTFGRGLETVCDFAFAGCESLKSVALPEGTKTVCGMAFWRCSSLESVAIPASVQVIKDTAFGDCSSLAEIEVDDANEAYKTVDGVLYTEDGARLVCCPAGLEYERVTVPEEVTAIAKCAFYGCSRLALIELPDGLTEIGANAFYCTAYYDDEANWEDGALYIGRYLIECDENFSGAYSIKPGTKLIADSAFYYCLELKSISIPDGVTVIGADAFDGCASLMSVTIPDSVTEIGSCAFVTCNSLINVTLPRKLTEIGEGVFLFCISLKRVVIPEGVTAIGDAAFRGCESMLYVSLPSSLKRVGYYAFDDCISLKKAYYAGTKSKWDGLSIDEGNEALLAATIVFEPAVEPGSSGDVNGDGKINAKDVTALMKHLVGADPKDFVEAAADVTGDGAVNAKDVVSLMKAIIAAK